MKKLSLAMVAMCFVACLFVFACRTPPDSVRVKMDYTPTNIIPPPNSLPDTAIFIGSFEDKRKTPDQIGENSEKSKAVPIKVEPAEVIGFVENAFKREFKRVGLSLVDSKDQAERILQVSVLNLWVEEKNIYESSIVAQVTVSDKSGKELFNKNFRALAKRWGSSYDEAEYRKVLSDSIVELLKNLFNDEAFTKSLT
jgi:uncharacterized lipoprotein YajG